MSCKKKLKYEPKEYLKSIDKIINKRSLHWKPFHNCQYLCQLYCTGFSVFRTHNQKVRRHADSHRGVGIIFASDSGPITAGRSRGLPDVWRAILSLADL